MAKKPKKLLTKEEKAERNRKRIENYNPVMAARNALRREFSRSPDVIFMMNDPATTRKVPVYKKDGERSKVDAKEHLCSKCKQWKRSTKKAKVAIDHIIPVVCPKAGYVDLNTYYSRLWVPKDQLQKLCGDCHNEKTQAEWFERRFKEEVQIVEKARLYMNSQFDRAAAKKMLQRFTKKKWTTGPYPKKFIEQVEQLKARLRGTA